VLTANAAITPLRWLVFVELPIDEAYAPLYASLTIRGVLLLGGLGLAVLFEPRACREDGEADPGSADGRCQDGAGGLDSASKSRPATSWRRWEDQFNGMAARLQDSYATLEGKVVERTRQLELANLAKTRFLAAGEPRFAATAARARSAGRPARCRHQSRRSAPHRRPDRHGGVGDERSIQRAARHFQARCRRRRAEVTRFQSIRCCAR